MVATYVPGPHGPIVLATTAAAANTTWDPSNKSANITLSGGDLIATTNTTNTNGNVVRSVASHSSGKYYAEFTWTNVVNVGGAGVGLINATQSVTAHYLGDTGNNSIGYYGNNSVYRNNASVATLQSYTTADVVCMAVDLDNGRIWWRVGAGNWNNNVANDPATNTGGIDISAISTPVYAACDEEHILDVVTANFGATAYAQTPPSGFGNW